jgi:hypothetical protein
MAVTAVTKAGPKEKTSAPKIDLAALSLGKIFQFTYKGTRFSAILISTSTSFLSASRQIANLNKKYGLLLTFPLDKSAIMCKQIGAQLRAAGAYSVFTGWTREGDKALAMSTSNQRTEELLHDANYRNCGLVLIEAPPKRAR